MMYLVFIKGLESEERINREFKAHYGSLGCPLYPHLNKLITPNNRVILQYLKSLNKYC